MTRRYLAQDDLFAVSASAKETALNTPQTLSTSMLVNKSNILQLMPRREDNSDEATGMEEADTVYDIGALAEGSIEFTRAQAQHFAFLLSYAMGSSTPAAWSTGYQHTIVPTASMDLPSFTAGQNLGATILKRRFAGMFVDKVSAVFAKDSWARVTGALKGTGLYADNVTKETVSGFYDATSLTLAANAVEGASAAARLDSIHLVRCQVPATLQWVDVVCSAVSDATPAILTIVAPGGAHTACNFEIIYVPDEAAWCTFPARVTETPLRVSDLAVIIGGKWNGSAFVGGHTMSAEINSITYDLDNRMAVEFRPGGTGAYANYALRGGRVQTLKLDREARDFIMQQHMIDNDYFGVSMTATGALFEAAHNYYVKGIFPRVAVLKSDWKIDGNVVAEAGDLKILQDSTYGSAIWTVGNKVAAYAG